jgi:ribosome maturation factor RimP
MQLRKYTAQVVTVGLFHISLINATGGLKGASPRPDLKQRVEHFGIGTELKLKLTNGEKLRGSVESIGADSFVVAPKDKAGATPEIAFNDLESANYPKRGYKTEDIPDAVAAKRMVVQLGVGEHIMVKVSPTEKVRGHIVAIQDDEFAILPDGEKSPRNVPYSSIHKVNKNLSLGATIAIVVGIAAAVVLILVLSGEEDIDVVRGGPLAPEVVHA